MTITREDIERRLTEAYEAASLFHSESAYFARTLTSILKHPGLPRHAAYVEVARWREVLREIDSGVAPVVAVLNRSNAA
jgi:hypothetical protein